MCRQVVGGWDSYIWEGSFVKRDWEIMSPIRGREKLDVRVSGALRIYTSASIQSFCCEKIFLENLTPGGALTGWGCGFMGKVPGYRSAGCSGVGQSAGGPGCGGPAVLAGAAVRGSGCGAWGWLRGPGASHLCGPCLPGCSGPAAAGPGCKASPRPSSRRAAVASAPTWCQTPVGQVTSLGAG